MPNNLANVNPCGLTEMFLFVITIIFGTAYTIYSKILTEMLGSTEDDTSTTPFQKSLFSTFGMFVGILFCLVVHWFVLLFRIPFPGYDFNDTQLRSTLLLESDALVGNAATSKKNLSVGMYVYLIIPAFFDVIGIALCMMGLQYVNASTYQMLRGSVMIFIALIKHNVLNQHLHKFHWVGVFWNVISVVLIGSTALLETLSTKSLQEEAGRGNDDVSTTQTLWGMWLIITGTFIIAVRCVIEERAMKTNIPAPLLLGMEGLWGILLCVFIMFLISYYALEDDNGSDEYPFQTWYTYVNSPNMQMTFIIYCSTSFGYNIFALTLMFVLSSVWYAIADNFRTITVWATCLVISYCIDPSFGELWTKYSYLEIVSLAILIYGTAIYNAPNDGSILLEGQWWALGINLSTEYETIRQEQLADNDAHLVYENLAEEFDAIVQKDSDETGHSQGNMCSPLRLDKLLLS